MKELHEIDKANFRNVTVPLEIDSIKEFFQNKELFFLIDYTQSKIKGNMFLTYISNMDLPCEILFLKASKAEKFELLKIYMETRNLNNSNSLKLASAQVMLEFNEFDTTQMLDNPGFTREECQEFIQANLEMIQKWDTFIRSSMIFMLTSIKDIEEEFQFKNTFKQINDPNYLGNNAVQLFSVPSFLEFYFSKQSSIELFYFKQQFEEYMFRGKNFFEFFACPQNSLYLTMQALINSDLDLSPLKTIFNKA